MRTVAFTVIAAATLAAAQLGSIPSCANSCVSQALPADCNLNPECICADASFISTISCCVSTACDTAGQQAALDFARQICAPVGVTNLPTAASCASGSASASVTSAASTSLSSSSLTSSASQAASSLSSNGSSVAASRTSSAASAASSASSSTASAASAGAVAAATMAPLAMAGAAALGALVFL